jgi:hypothetical protein
VYYPSTHHQFTITCIVLHQEDVSCLLPSNHQERFTLNSLDLLEENFLFTTRHNRAPRRVHTYPFIAYYYTCQKTLLSVHSIQSVVLFFCSTMAHWKKKLQAYDNRIGPVRRNTVARCNSASIIESNCIAEGTPSHSFSNETDEEDILVPDKISIVYHSCSDALLCNNQELIPPNIITKLCHPPKEENICVCPFLHSLLLVLR